MLERMLREAEEHNPWLSLWRRAYARNRRQRYVQLATVSPEGLPEVRTVVLRGIDDTGRPYVFSDGRSAKIAALRAGSLLEMHVYWDKSKEQFRLRGHVQCYPSLEPTPSLDEDAKRWQAKRQELWQAQGERGQQLFVQGAPGSSLEQRQQEAIPHEAPAHFCLLVLQAQRCDYLRLGEPQERRCYWLEHNTWQGGLVIP